MPPLKPDFRVLGVSHHRHINGGHTALPEAHVCERCERSRRAIELVRNGNERVAIAAAKAALQMKCPHRVILGTDRPAGSGVQPLGNLRLIAMLSRADCVPPSPHVAQYNILPWLTNSSSEVQAVECC